jgi:hypothetical protein
MLRKQVIKAAAVTPVPTPGEIDIAAVATVQVTSEATDHPVDHAFDGSRGPGGTRWIAGEPGDQTLILVFPRTASIPPSALGPDDRMVVLSCTSNTPSPCNAYPR